MKKIILSIIITFLFINIVEAKVYYSDYGEFSEYSEEEIFNSDIMYVESFDKYQLYREEIIYEYLEESDFEPTGKTKVEETMWVSDYSLIDKNKNIEKCYRYETMSIKEYNYLLIDNQSEFNLILKNFKLINLNGEVIMERSNIKLFDFSKYYIDLNEFGYRFDEIKLEAIFEKEDPNQKGEISLGYYLNIKDDSTNLTNKVREVIVDANILEDSVDDFSIYSQYTQNCYDHIPEDNRNYKTYYRNVTLLNEYKVINKNYIDDYDIEARDGYLIDKEKVKTYYRYKSRDKVEIKDNLLIDSNNIMLDSFIIYSTIPITDIKIISNVDYTKNGIYKVSYILPFETINRDVEVNIINNFTNTINKQVEYISELKNKVEVANYAVEKKNLEIKQLILEEENKINKISNELNACYSEKNELKNKKISLGDETKKSHNKVKYIFIIMTLMILLIVFKKNMHKKII